MSTNLDYTAYVAAEWDTSTGATPEYQEDLRPELIEYINQADRPTLKMIQKFIKSLRR